MPRFLERDEAEREPPCAQYPWDGVRNVRPFSPARRRSSSRGSTDAASHRSHIPILRQGRPYRSLDVATAVHYRTREPFVEMSQANPGLIRRDLLRAGGDARARWRALPVARAGRDVERAAELFLQRHAAARRDGIDQTPDDYVRAALGDDRHAARAGAPQHGEDPRRAGADATRCSAA